MFHVEQSEERMGEQIKAVKIDDRSEWPAGEWDKEPEDRVEFKTKEGYPALMRRNALGAWCGYVAVPPGHPDHGKTWDELEGELSVHGGVTYADKCDGEVCHVPAPGEPADVWWIGFDCVHEGDDAPGMFDADFREEYPDSFMGKFGNHYRGVGYVRREIADLSEQLAERAAP